MFSKYLIKLQRYSNLMAIQQMLFMILYNITNNLWVYLYKIYISRYVRWSH